MRTTFGERNGKKQAMHTTLQLNGLNEPRNRSEPQCANGAAAPARGFDKQGTSTRQEDQPYCGLVGFIGFRDFWVAREPRI